MVLAQAVIVAVVHVPDDVLIIESMLIDDKRSVIIDILPGTALASGLIGKLPCKDSGFVDIAAHKGLDVVLEGGLDSRIGIEEIVVGRICDLLHVDVHSSVIRPSKC